MTLFPLLFDQIVELLSKADVIKIEFEDGDFTRIQPAIMYETLTKWNIKMLKIRTNFIFLFELRVNKKQVSIRRPLVRDVAINIRSMR